MFHLDLLENPKHPKSNFWGALLAFVLILMMGVILTSCVTKDKCDRKYPVQSKDSIYVKDSIVYVNDTLWLEPEKFEFRDSIPCPDYKGEVKQPGRSVSVSINKGKLRVVCREDSLMRIIKKERMIRISMSSKQVVTPPVIITKSYWYDTYFFRPVAILLLFALCLFLLFLAFFPRDRFR